MYKYIYVNVRDEEVLQDEGLLHVHVRKQPHHTTVSRDDSERSLVVAAVKAALAKCTCKYTRNPHHILSRDISERLPLNPDPTKAHARQCLRDLPLHLRVAAVPPAQQEVEGARPHGTQGNQTPPQPPACTC